MTTPLGTEPPPEVVGRLLITFHDGIPAEDGWYLVELEEDSADLLSMPFSVDYCRAKSPSDGGGREWMAYYHHNIKRWAKLPS